MTKPVVTRFAPSPTGFLHIGGARTALFNWLYAKHTGGKMLLRIEDTDRERSTEPAIQAIIDGLDWLGLHWDGDVVYQFQRIDRHQEVVQNLLDQGKAYYCYASPQELDEMREKARSEGQPLRYDGRWRDRNPNEAPEGVKPVVRLKAPLEGETIVADKVQGRVTWQNKDLDDLVLLRSDGTPTYMLAVVVDDHDMDVTHIIRGDDHFTNAARQSQIYDALGWDIPVMAHIPLIHGPDGAKLSKRHGALGIEAYREMGYLPVALRNYLVRLGWSHGDQEIFSTDEMIEAFDLNQIGRSPSRIDFAKLENLNGHYLRHMDDAQIVAAIEDIIPDVGGERKITSPLSPLHRQQLEQAMTGLKERAKTLIELIDNAYFIFGERPLILDEKAKALLAGDGLTRLKACHDALASLNEWTIENTEQAIRDTADQLHVKLGQVAQPLRAAITGRATSPGLFEVMIVIGREETLGRLQDQLKFLSAVA
jgi:glutamyl-tRNA synthetase